MATLTTVMAGFSAVRAPSYALRFPECDETCPQNEEWCEVYCGGHWRRIRLHDYAAIYRLPGLYSQIFADHLQCTSPQRVVDLLAGVLADWGQDPSTLRVLDFGAGNGLVGEQLRRLGVRSLIGADILSEAAAAASRERPALYDDYVVADFCDLKEQHEARVARARPNCLVTVAALGFNDVPPRAFATALNLIDTPGWVAFNIKETFLSGIDESGFSRLIRALTDQQVLQIQAYRRYCHRLSVAGQRLHYVAVVARALQPIPADLLENLSHD